MATMRGRASGGVMPVFFRLWVRLAETPMQNMSTSQASPRSRPFSLSTNAESTHVRRLCSAPEKCLKSASVSAICGTFCGLTNEPSWMMSMPEPMHGRDPADPLLQRAQ